MTIGKPQVPAIRHPVHRQMRFLRFSSSDFIWTMLYGMFALVVNAAFGGNYNNLFIAVLIGIWVISMLIPETNRDERIYQMPLSFIADCGLALKKGRIWSQEMKEPRGKRAIKPFPLEVREVGTIGLIYDQTNRTYSMIISSEGSAVSSLSMLGQYGVVQDLTALIVRAAAAAGRNGLKIAMGVRARPEDKWKVPNQLSQVADLDVLLPEVYFTEKPENEWTMDDKLNVRLNEFMDDLGSIADISASVDMYMVITVKDSEEFRRGYKDGVLHAKDVRNLTITRIQNVVLPYLRRIIGPIAVLDGEGAERYLRTAWDLVTLDDYYGVVQRRTSGQLEDEESYIQYLPTRSITVGKDYVEIDGTYATTLKLTAFPEEVHAHQGAELYDSMARWSSVSVISETIHGGREYSILNALSGLSRDTADTIGLVRSGPKVDRREQEQYEHLKELDDAVYVQDFVPVIVVFAHSKAELEEECSLEADRLTAAGYKHFRVTGRSKQLSSFLTATTLIDLE